MYEARWMNSNPQWIPVDVREAARLLARYPGGSSKALDLLNEDHLPVVSCYCEPHPPETQGVIEVRLREAVLHTRPTPTPEPDGDILWA